jgi:hypothetical protein
MQHLPLTQVHMYLKNSSFSGLKLYNENGLLMLFTYANL